MDWSKFDNNDELEALTKELEEIDNGTGERKDVPVGEYEATITKLELKESKSGKPMVSIWFKIVSGAYKNQLIFYNQIVERAFQIHLIKEFFKPFNLKNPVTFTSYGQFENCLATAADELKNVEFALDYSVNEKGFSSYLVTQVFPF